MSEKSQFALIYDVLGYSPGSVPWYPAAKVTEIQISKLRNLGDAEALSLLNDHPLMQVRGHCIRLVP